MGWQTGLTVLRLNGNHGLLPELTEEYAPEATCTPITAVEDATREENPGLSEETAADAVMIHSQPPEAERPMKRGTEVPSQLSEWSPVFSCADNRSYAAEQYRIIRTKMLQRVNCGARLVVTSPGIGDGKTVNAINLAAALAMKTEGQTLLIDADLRRASVHRWMNIPLSPGLAEVLSGECEAQDAILPVKGLPGLLVMTAGQARENPTELLDSSRWRSLAEIVRRKFSQVIIDCPPVEVLADYDLIAAVCDGVILVVRPDHTNRPGCFAALAKVRPKLTGVLLNETRDWFFWKKGVHSAYYYSRKYESRKPAV